VGFAGAQLRPCALSNYIYEQRLLRKIRRQSSPRHVGIILHGNRRHGRSLGLTDPQAIYRLGAQKLGHMLGWCAELSIPAVTLWVFSTDNLQRPPVEVTGIFGAIETKMAALASHPRPEPPPSP
jgi:short-chain Z-isoprenyl diphosphate synthase